MGPLQQADLCVYRALCAGLVCIKHAARLIYAQTYLYGLKCLVLHSDDTWQRGSMYLCVTLEGAITCIVPWKTYGTCFFLARAQAVGRSYIKRAQRFFRARIGCGPVLQKKYPKIALVNSACSACFSSLRSLRSLRRRAAPANGAC